MLLFATSTIVLADTPTDAYLAGGFLLTQDNPLEVRVNPAPDNGQTLSVEISKDGNPYTATTTTKAVIFFCK
ncbi:hypothetical protein [Carboxydothermus ferrireducens]|uniref:Uncharacterized protein n=1 Tax=Carboxydothermus ferrireducens DSM 11255 TaxID=1119529 RepID=A0ABX2R9G5_9THEO|nr:hypothetical protein [Carboxydothermus ferrireducens]NYE57809.1 hypothetical protein [Carboxydothermus ferrireducens DSM 11255]